MNAPSARATSWRELTLPALAATLGLLAHLFTAGNYGLFRDELYYLDCARHLDWGYVDHPPLSMALLRLWISVFGDSQASIRILPALAGFVLVILTGLLARRMGAGRFGSALASLSCVCVPVYLVNTGFFSMNAFELVFWALAFLLLAHLCNGGNPRWWLGFGLWTGMALQNKIGLVALLLGLVPALLASGQGRHLKSRYFWLGAALAALVFLPHLWWQYAHGWPTLEFVRNATAGKIVHLSLWQFFISQIMILGPAQFLIWLPGLVLLLLWHRLREFRALGVIWMLALLFFGLQASKPYYLSPAYPPLLAAGAFGMEQLFSGRLRWLRVVVSVLPLAVAAEAFPITFPCLPPQALVEHMRKIGVRPQSGETSGRSELPQHFADRFGWEEMAAKVAEVYHHLDDSLRASCIIVAKNYGEAGALNYYRRKYDLPRTYCQHNNYYLWGTDSAKGDVVLTLNQSVEDLRETFANVTQVGTVNADWVMSYETGVPLCLCTGLMKPWPLVWAEGRFYY